MISDDRPRSGEYLGASLSGLLYGCIKGQECVARDAHSLGMTSFRRLMLDPRYDQGCVMRVIWPLRQYFSLTVIG